MPKKQKLQGRKVQKPNKLAAKVSAGPTTTAHAARSPLGKPISHYKAECNLKSFRKEAKRVGFDAQAYLENGYCILRPLWRDKEVQLALAAAQRVRSGSRSSDNQGEFVFLRGSSTPDKLLLFSLLNRYLPFLHQLLEGIVLPGSNNSPYGHHNQVQVAVKRPGFEGYTDLARMSSSRVGHIDQSSAKQTPPGKPTSNYSVLFGVVLSGETKTRSDAGNLYLAPGSYQKLAKAFQAFQGKVPWHPNITEHYLGEEDPKMEAVRASPGEAILMHHQTVHGVGPNHSNTDRVNVYFRITASGRPDGLKTSYPKAMREPLLETPLLQTLAGAE
ncbi:unnamed protein product [Durusdinium trenchii]|uniref:Phytanoyl-CoA dioxygenase n=1 Tax=Durusdinium trenchii TaxID=1381693 RepID=A0ABP0RX95_9DINO